MMALKITFIVITRDRPRIVKRLVHSILKAGLNSFSVVLIDDSSLDSFLQTRDFMKSLSVSFVQLSSLQAGELVEKALEKANFKLEERNFIRKCTGLDSPFTGFVESFFVQHSELKPDLDSAGWQFAPYSPARNLGIFCALRFFDPDIICFLDDDCLLVHTEKLRSALQLIGTELNQRRIAAVAGIYRNLPAFEPMNVSKQQVGDKALRIFRGIDAFLRKSLAIEKARFTLMPPHMLGGALILGKSVFHKIPFDPFVARGEDHAYALDLRYYIGGDEIVIRDNHFVVGHQREAISQEKSEMNVLRDIFRFVYIKAKTGRSFISFFTARSMLASLIMLFVRPSDHRHCENELKSLLLLAPRFARENGDAFRRCYRAWHNFLHQSGT